MTKAFKCVKCENFFEDNPIVVELSGSPKWHEFLVDEKYAHFDLCGKCAKIGLKYFGVKLRNIVYD